MNVTFGDDDAYGLGEDLFSGCGSEILKLSFCECDSDAEEGDGQRLGDERSGDCGGRFCACNE